MVSLTAQVAIYRCLLDIAAGMDYLHSLGVLHGESYSLVLAVHSHAVTGHAVDKQPFQEAPALKQAVKAGSFKVGSTSGVMVTTVQCSAL